MIKYFKNEPWTLNNRKNQGSITKDIYVVIESRTTKNVVYIDNQSFDCSLGEDEQYIYSEVHTDNKIYIVTLSKKKNVFSKIVFDERTGFTVNNEPEDSLGMRIAALTLRVHTMCDDADFMENCNALGENLLKIGEKNISDTRFLSLSQDFAEVMSKILKYAQFNNRSAENKAILAIDINQFESGSLNPKNVYYGHFQAFYNQKKKKKIETYKDIKDKYILNENRIFSSEEQSLMYKVPEWHIPSANVISIAEKIKASWVGDNFLRKTNILMEGPKGTGKTSDAKMLAALLGIPYTKYTCFSDMDSASVTGGIYPVLDENKPVYFPSDDEFFFDPAGCYEKITGKTLSPEEKMNISEEDARLAFATECEKRASNKKNSEPEYVFHPSEFVKAFENGWLIEIQEPTVISDPGVLMILNSALEKDGIINLPHKNIHRHPETIVVITTNRDYEGCRPLNQALRDRFNISKKVKLPSKEEQISRLKAATHCTNNAMLENLVSASKSLNEFLHNEGINDTVSLRGMQDFVSDVLMGFDVRESVMEDIVYKITTDDDEVAEIESFLELSTSIFSITN